MRKLGFKQCQAKHTVFYRYMGKDMIIVTIVDGQKLEKDYPWVQESTP